ncbi:GNAT family N-acetyltransferase [Actinacidiphila alni]|uniref:GNAT family N-acetyltransferase n=1 Tax=Actinacidiphila alni TaxID=380248 RepID=UPI003456609A
MVRIRMMAAGDIEAVSGIRVRGWQAAYAGIVPQGFLDAMDVAEDAAARREFFAKSAGRVHNLVAVGATADGGEEVVGWASLGPYRGEEAGPEVGELYALYARTDRIGTGVGRALTAAACARAAELGHGRLLLWVLADNARGRRFYARAGFAPDGAETVHECDGVPLREVRYARAV